MSWMYGLEDIVRILLLVMTAVNGVKQTDEGVSPSVPQLCPSACSCLGNVVDCSQRSLTSVPAGLPLWTETLDVSSNDITALDPHCLQGLDRLIEINLNENRLTSFNLSLLHPTTQVTTLKLSSNQLRRLTPAIASGNISTTSLQLTHLLIDHNVISDVRQVPMTSLPSLQVVDVSHNRLTRLGNDSFPFTTQLRHLFLDSNQITSIEQGTFKTTMSLEWLKLSRNRLRSLQKHTFHLLHQLKYLELERNKLRVLEGLVFQGLESLLSLKLKRNAMSDLMDGTFWGLGKILSLDLSFNNISTVSKRWLYGLNSLQRLSLGHNRVGQIEADAWQFCQHLIELDLRHNELRSLTDNVFVGLDSLQRLNLANNHISYIADTGFHGLAGLQALDLSSNEISWTLEDESSVFDSLTSLGNLQLAHNHIRSVSKRVFAGLSRLRHLNLDDNEISDIHVAAFEAMSDLRDFRLNSSSLLCDCQLPTLTQWLRRTGFHVSVDARCRYPESLTGVNILDVQPRDVSCVNYAKPVVTREPVSQKALRFGNVTMVCEAASSSDSTLSISWKKENEVLPSDDVDMKVLPPTDGMLLQVVSRLHIWPVQDSHAGRYQCVATNQLGSTYSTRAIVTVNVYPTFIKTPQDVSVRVGTTARLDCAAAGTPTPEIALQKDGGDDFPAARERRMHIFPSDEMFFIVDAKVEDQGVYTCTARNDVGVITANATLQVLEAPSFAQPMEDQVVAVGSTAVMQCMTAGSPRPRLTWLKDSVVFIPTLRHFFTADDQLLVIVQTAASDAGNYTCVITNVLGSDRQTCRMLVVTADKHVVSDSGAATSSSDTTTTAGIIVIAVVVCVIVTSLVWFIVIYKSRRRRSPTPFHSADVMSACDAACHRTMSSVSDVDGSAQRLLACGSSHNDFLHTGMKCHDRSVDLTSRYLWCQRLAAESFRDIDSIHAVDSCRHHQCCLVTDRLCTADILPVDRDWSESGSAVPDSSVTDNTSISADRHTAAASAPTPSPQLHTKSLSYSSISCPPHTVDDVECRISAGACHETSTVDVQRRSHSATELNYIGQCRRTTRMSCSVPLVPARCEHTQPGVGTSSSSSKLDDALQTDCGVNSIAHHYQHL